MPDIGPEVAGSIRSFFANEGNLELLERLRAIGLWPKRQDAPPASEGADAIVLPLQGLKVLFTGSLTRVGRTEAEDMARAAGANIASSVTKSLDLLVVGGKPGSKLEKARKLGIRVMEEADFFAMLASGVASVDASEAVAEETPPSQEAAGAEDAPSQGAAHVRTASDETGSASGDDSRGAAAENDPARPARGGAMSTAEGEDVPRGRAEQLKLF